MTNHPVEAVAREADSVTGQREAPSVTGQKMPAALLVVTESMKPGETVDAVFQRLAVKLAIQNAEILSLMIYGSVAARRAIDRAMVAAFGAAQWPVTWIEGASCEGEPLAGVQAYALAGQTITRVRLGHRVVGSVFAESDARHCLLGGLGPTDPTLGAAEQVQQTFGQLEQALDQAGFELADVVRTWFYNDDILGWYADFNRVRSAHYSGVKWRTGSLPASTGIGARNSNGAALTVGAWALRPTASSAFAREIGSPLQCPAPKYGSAFSRAMEIHSGGGRRLLVSGTASIFPDGKTAWVGNVKQQIELTMEVVAAILQSRGMMFRDVTRATAYFPHPLFKAHFDAWLEARALRALPVVPTHSVICRRELLFEIEVDAAAPL